MWQWQEIQALLRQMTAMEMTMYDSVQVPGFLGNGVAAGIKGGEDRDLSLIFSEVPARAVGVFTTNRLKAAPVVLDMERPRPL